VFNNGDGTGLDLNTANRDYTIRTNFFTDFAVNGAAQVFDIDYLAGPCYDLSQLTAIVKMDDDGSHATIDPLVSGTISGAPAYPSKFYFTDISDLMSITESFDHIDITATDNLGATATATIWTQGGGEWIHNGDGTGIDLVSPNGSYEIVVTLYTAECMTGHQLTYNISYTYTPCSDLATLTDVADYDDANSNSIAPLANTSIPATGSAGGTISLTESASGALPSGHTFDHMDMVLEDDLGGAHILSTTTPGDTLVFNDGDGGLDLTSTQRTYYVTLVLYTDLCTSGTTYSYTVQYL